MKSYSLINTGLVQVWKDDITNCISDIDKSNIDEKFSELSDIIQHTVGYDNDNFKLSLVENPILGDDVLTTLILNQGMGIGPEKELRPYLENSLNLMDGSEDIEKSDFSTDEFDLNHPSYIAGEKLARSNGGLLSPDKINEYVKDGNHDHQHFHAGYKSVKEQDCIKLPGSPSTFSSTDLPIQDNSNQTIQMKNSNINSMKSISPDSVYIVNNTTKEVVSEHPNKEAALVAAVSCSADCAVRTGSELISSGINNYSDCAVRTGSELISSSINNYAEVTPATPGPVSIETKPVETAPVVTPNVENVIKSIESLPATEKFAVHDKVVEELPASVATEVLEIITKKTDGDETQILAPVADKVEAIVAGVKSGTTNFSMSAFKRIAAAMHNYAEVEKAESEDKTNTLIRQLEELPKAGAVIALDAVEKSSSPEVVQEIKEIIEGKKDGDEVQILAPVVDKVAEVINASASMNFSITDVIRLAGKIQNFSDSKKEIHPDKHYVGEWKSIKGKGNHPVKIVHGPFDHEWMAEAVAKKHVGTDDSGNWKGSELIEKGITNFSAATVDGPTDATTQNVADPVPAVVIDQKLDAPVPAVVGTGTSTQPLVDTKLDAPVPAVVETRDTAGVVTDTLTDEMNQTAETIVNASDTTGPRTKEDIQKDLNAATTDEDKDKYTKELQALTRDEPKAADEADHVVKEDIVKNFSGDNSRYVAPVVKTLDYAQFLRHHHNPTR